MRDVREEFEEETENLRDVMCTDVTVDVASNCGCALWNGKKLFEKAAFCLSPFLTVGTFAPPSCGLPVPLIFCFVFCLRAGKEDFCISSFQNRQASSPANRRHRRFAAG
jgi:hypothetical protein